jgi:3-oxoacyl-[acyl-carrier protein] reductase
MPLPNRLMFARMSLSARESTVLHHHGRIDILVNSAGVIRRLPVECITSQDWDEVLAVNVKGTFFASRTVMPSMQQRKKGRIINIASNSGKTGALVAGFHYAASKAAVIGLTKSFARLLAGSGVTVNAVSPGPTMTPAVADLSEEETAHLQAYIPLGRLASPGEIAGAVVFLASDLSSFMTGEIMDVDGGVTMD